MNRRDFLTQLGLVAGGVAFGAVTLSLPGATGKTITTEGWSTDDDSSLDIKLRVGDVFTIAGMYAMNPIARRNTPSLQQFVVTNIVESDVTFHPVRFDIPRRHRKASVVMAGRT